MNINMTSNASAVQKAMQGFSKQFPFAMSQALNATAFQIRKEIVEKTYPQSFDAKNRAFANAMMRVEKANKRKLSAAVFDRFKRNYMTNQAEGGIKQKRGRYIAIPAADRPKVSGKATYNRVHPRQVLSRPKAFVQTAKNSTMILERRTKKRYPLKKLYVLHTSSPRIPKRFPFYEDANRVARQRFDKNFAKAFKRAKATARR